MTVTLTGSVHETGSPGDRRSRRWLLPVGGLVLALLIVSRVQLATGFALVTGDLYDGRIEVSLLEHWFNALRGLEPWNRPGYFFPHPNTLGYNDGYLLYGLVYSVFRACGVEPMLGAELVDLVMRLVGYAAFLAVAIEIAALPLVWATLGAVLFTVANNMYVQVLHAQLLCTGLAPALAWLLFRGWSALPGRPGQAACYGSGAGLLFGCWLLTGYYTAWFTAFFALLMALSATLLAPPWRRSWRPLAASLLRWPVLLTLAVSGVSILPFLFVYLQAAGETGQHLLVTALAGLPTPRDLIRVGPDNVLFGWFDSWLDAGAATPPDLESIVGFTLPVWVLAIAGGVFAWSGKSTGTPERRLLWRATTLASLLGLFFCVHLFDGVPWHVIYKLVPGARGLRQITRFLLFLDGPVLLLAMLAMHRLAIRLRAGSGRIRRCAGPILVGIAGLTVAAEINTQDAQSLDRPTERGELDAIPAAPANCRAFYVVSRGFQEPHGSYAIDSLYHHTVDAMMLAEQRALPTLNGFATFVPPDSAAINRLPVTADRVRSFLDHHHVAVPVCALDLDTRRWTDGPVAAPSLAADDTIRFGGPNANADPFLRGGWSHAEPDGRWTDGGHARIEMSVPATFANHVLGLTVDALPFFPPGRPASAVELRANGVPIARWLPKPGQQRFIALMSRGWAGLPRLRLDFEIETPVSPRDTDGTPDDRRLGLRFSSLRLDAIPDEMLPHP